MCVDQARQNRHRPEVDDARAVGQDALAGGAEGDDAAVIDRQPAVANRRLDDR